ncbi:MAG: hypothetical protein JWP59_4634 [Massilia sp.]|nr:hypothetical protein [Massilia sp.]
MTGTASAPSLPPSDLNKRSLPIIELDLTTTELLRIHNRKRGPIFYNSTTASKVVFRFDAPAAQYGVLYCAQSFDTCMAETIVRARFENVVLPLVLTESELSERSVTAITADRPGTLKLADFTVNCLHLGLTGQVMAHPTYGESNAWSLAVHNHPQTVDGIYFRSRYANAPSIALFEDRVMMVPKEPPTVLPASPHLAPFLNRFQVELRA